MIISTIVLAVTGGGGAGGAAASAGGSGGKSFVRKQLERVAKVASVGLTLKDEVSIKSITLS